MHWTVVVPVKGLPNAKSRLSAATASPSMHRRLAEAMRADTLAAAAAARSVARVLVVTDTATAADGLDVAHVLVQHGAGLNAALREGAAHAAQHWPEDGVALLVGDLPALRAKDLDDALAGAATVDLAVVTDADGTGTTMLTARPGVMPRPQFGPDSARRHGAQAHALPAAASVRRDVDTPADLQAARALGVGPATAAALTPDAVAG